MKDLAKPEEIFGSLQLGVLKWRERLPQPAPPAEICGFCKRNKAVCNCPSTVSEAMAARSDRQGGPPRGSRERLDWVVRQMNRLYLEHDPAGIERLIRQELA